MSGGFGRKLVALDPDTGALLPYFNGINVATPLRFTANAEVFRFDIGPDGTKPVGVGNFQNVNGLTPGRSCSISKEPHCCGGTTRRWSASATRPRCPGLPGNIHDVGIAPNSQFFTFAASRKATLSTARALGRCCVTQRPASRSPPWRRRCRSG